MTVAGIQKLGVDFGGKFLFRNVTFDVNEGDFVGLIGANGTGKTTLFKIITGEIEPAEGGVFISGDTRLGYLEQHACSGSTKTVYDEALGVFDYLVEIEKEIEEISKELETGGGDTAALIEKQSFLQEKFNGDEGLTFRSKTRSALLGLGFSQEDLSLTCDKLSGGQRSKLSMCKLLLSRADLMLLDEPTNHLDIAASEWLESFLQGYKGTVIVISHDRYFLDKVCNKTVEIANGRGYCTKGNYSEYQRLKAARLESERRQYENQLEEIKRIEDIIEQQRSFARERNFITAESKRKMLEKKKAELVPPERDPAEMRIKFSPECESGNDVLFVNGLSKSFGNKLLFENGSFEIHKGDRAFIIGANGCGKTTLFRILTRSIEPDSGVFNFGTSVKAAYFDQSLESLKGGKTVLNEIWDEHRLMKETQVRNYLAAFLFRGNDVFKNVDSLSGGEKAKLCLLKLMLSGANVLLLDEPTNHLDIVSREILENALSDFEGTIIAVSHDRYFINKLSTEIFRLTQSGFEKFDGSYDDYCANVLLQPQKKKEAKEPKVNSYKLRKERESEINRLKGKIKRTEAEIDTLDGEVASLNEELKTPEVSADYEKIIAITAEIEEKSARQTELMDEWEEMSSRLGELLSEEAE